MQYILILLIIILLIMTKNKHNEKNSRHSKKKFKKTEDDKKTNKESDISYINSDERDAKEIAKSEARQNSVERIIKNKNKPKNTSTKSPAEERLKAEKNKAERIKNEQELENQKITEAEIKTLDTEKQKNLEADKKAKQDALKNAQEKGEPASIALDDSQKIINSDYDFLIKPLKNGVYDFSQINSIVKYEDVKNHKVYKVFPEKEIQDLPVQLDKIELSSENIIQFFKNTSSIPTVLNKKYKKVYQFFSEEEHDIHAILERYNLANQNFDKINSLFEIDKENGKILSFTDKISNDDIAFHFINKF